MESREVMHIHESCLVPYRHSALGIEFCLLSTAASGRWEFPKALTEADVEYPQAVLHEAAASAGLLGDVDGPDPLDAFVAARGNEARRMTAYLMHVTQVHDDWPNQSTHRRLWCLPEEARVRLRRKPMRRFIDNALRLVGLKTSPPGEAVDRLPRKPR